MKTAILISGRGSNMEALINASKTDGFPAEITLVVSDNPEAKGLEIAKQAGVTTAFVNRKDFKTKQEFEGEIQKNLEENNIELVCLAGFMRILSKEFVEKWQGRMINIHPSLLPAFKGLDTHKRAIETGVKVAGATVHFVSPEMDSGPIILQATVPVYQDDTEETLAERILKEEHKIYPLALKMFAEGRLTIEGNIVKVSS